MPVSHSHLDSSVTAADSQHAPQTTVTCRCCGQPVEVIPWMIRDRDLSMLTCRNIGCGMQGYTFTLSDYHTVDTSIYCEGS